MVAVADLCLTIRAIIYLRGPRCPHTSLETRPFFSRWLDSLSSDTDWASFVAHFLDKTDEAEVKLPPMSLLLRHGPVVAVSDDVQGPLGACDRDFSLPTTQRLLPLGRNRLSSPKI